MEVRTTQKTRYRERGTTSVISVTNEGWRCDGQSAGTSSVSSHREGMVEGCVDTTTPKFRILSAEGKIVNNEFFKVKQTFEGGGTGNATRSRPCTIPTALSGTDWNSSQRTFNTGFRFPEYRTDGQLICPATIVDLASAIREASTQALAAVDTSTAEGLVTLKELGQTYQMLRHPLSSLDRLTQAWADSKRMDRAVKQVAAKGPRAFADQYLVYYYGMRPFLNDISNIIDAYLHEGITPERQTARGNARRHKIEEVTEGGPGLVPGKSWYQNLLTREDTVTVRSGILYSPTPNTYQKVMGFRLSDVPSAIWEATPWSFFYDYFGNIGDVIKALTPRPGVVYLAAWNTVETHIRMEARTIASGVVGPSSSYQARQGTEWARVIIEATHRQPVTPYDSIGLSLRFDPETWSSAKALAVSCLAIQQVHSKLGGRIQRALNDYMRMRRKATRKGGYSYTE